MEKINKNLFSLNGKVAIVTGGCGHLGSSMVDVLLSFDATVIVGDLSEDVFEKRFNNYDREKLSFFQLDVTKSERIDLAFSSAVKKYGQIDILINNAVTARGNSPENMSDEDWSFSVDGVLGSVHRCIRSVIPYMKKAGSGKIINISSMYGLVSPDFRVYDGDQCEKYLNPPHYGAGKAAILQLTRYYAAYLGKYRIHVNAITPGAFPNMEIQKANPAFIERLKVKNPLGRIGSPEDIKGAILLLSSEASDYITGQNIIIDGGWTVW